MPCFRSRTWKSRLASLDPPKALSKLLGTTSRPFHTEYALHGIKNLWTISRPFYGGFKEDKNHSAWDTPISKWLHPHLNDYFLRIGPLDNTQISSMRGRRWRRRGGWLGKGRAVLQKNLITPLLSKVLILIACTSLYGIPGHRSQSAG